MANSLLRARESTRSETPPKVGKNWSQTLLNAMSLLPAIFLVDITMSELYLKTLHLYKGYLISSEILSKNMVLFRLISGTLMRRNSQ